MGRISKPDEVAAVSPYVFDMNALSDPAAAAAAWPAARPAGIEPIQHPAWEEARNAILDLAAEGPVTAVIVGQTGTGKSWLLRELASALGDYGFPTMMLLQGNLPMNLGSGTALLVDQATMMDPVTRAELLAQDQGVVVMAATEWPDDAADQLSPKPVIVPLRLLRPYEVAEFAGEWLHRSELPPTLDPAAMNRLIARSGGRVATVVTLLAETVSIFSQPLAAPLQAAPVPMPVSTASPATLPELPPTPRRATIYRPLIAASAVAAALLLGWILLPTSTHTTATPTTTTVAEAPPPPPAIPAPASSPPSIVASTAPAAPLPPVEPAETPRPAPTAVASATPEPPIPSAPAVAADSPPASPTRPALPPIRNADVSAPALAAPASPPRLPDILPETQASPALPAVAAGSPPPLAASAAPTLVATLNDPTSTALAAQAAPVAPVAEFAPRPTSHNGGPGLVLVAQRGDTLQSLYDSVYRDRHAPPFTSVLAANPRPFKPGAIVVFPEPLGGWERAQR